MTRAEDWKQLATDMGKFIKQPPAWPTHDIEAATRRALLARLDGLAAGEEGTGT